MSKRSGADLRDAGVRAIAKKILAGAKLTPEQREFWRQPLRDLEKLLRRDYREALRSKVRRAEVEALIGTAQNFWPKLNRAKTPLPTKADYLEISRKLALNLSFRGFRQRDGMALRGFYMRPGTGSNRRQSGLVYLNTAHHPTAVGATFCHEIGHHLALSILPPQAEGAVHYFFDAAYSSHLDDAPELAADILVSLFAYPRPAARKIFGKGSESREDLGGDLHPILRYLKAGWDIDLEESRQPRHHLIYLVGMVHYAKLRRALLEEYRI